MRASALLAACLACAAAHSASAQDFEPEITLEGAQAIEADIKIWIRDYYGRQFPPGMELTMDIDVRPAEGRYALVLRDVRINAVGVGAFDFGTTTTELVPLENGWYDTDTRLPDRMVFSIPGESSLIVTIADQSFTGVFAPEVDNFADFDMRLDGISIAMAGQPHRMTIDSYHMRGEAEAVTEGRGDYEALFEIADFGFSSPDVRVSIEQIWADASLGGFAMHDYMEFYGDYVDIMMPAGALHGGINPLGIEQFADLLERTGTLFESFDYEVGVAGVEVDDAGDAFRLDEAVVRVAGGPFGPGRSAINLSLSIGPADAVPAEPLMPNEIDLEIAALNIPNQALWTGMIAALRLGSTGGDPTRAEQIGLEILGALAAAESRLSLGTLNLRTPDSWLEAAGELRTDSASLVGATGDGWIDMGGINAYLADLAAEREAAPLIAFLTVMQTVSRLETADRAMPYRRLEIELDGQGQVLVNGADIAPLLEGLD